jgi:hypothetical protein
MRFFAFLICASFASFASAALVKREAAAEAEPAADPEAEPVYGLNASGGYAAPVCSFTPVKTCKPRQVSTPRKVCQTVVDIYEDVVVTEKCREVVTTTCTQTTQTATHTAAVVDTSTNLVQAGIPKPAVRRRREAEAEAEAKPEAEAEADAHYGAVIAPVALVHAPVIVTTHEPVKSAGYPVCNSVPVKTCERIPTATPRNVARTVCDTVVDVTTIEDCTETVTKHCQHTSSSTSSSSKVVGSHSQVVASALNAVAHPAVPTNIIG